MIFLEQGTNASSPTFGMTQYVGCGEQRIFTRDLHLGLYVLHFTVEDEAYVFSSRITK